MNNGLSSIKSNFLWDIAYICYFMSFFIYDVAFQSESTQTLIMKIFKYLSYFIFVIVLILNTNVKFYRFIVCLFAVIVAAISTLFTKDLYFETLFFVVLTSIMIKPKHIVKVSYYLLITASVFVLLGMLLNIIPNVNTPRAVDQPRFGLGFYHSDVLPLILFYLIVYRILICCERIRLFQIVFWLALDVGLYFVCNSKNGLIGVGLLCLGCFVYGRRKKKERRFILFIAEYLAIGLSVFSLVGMLIQGSGSTISTLLNKALTNRLFLAYKQYKSMGLHLFNKLDWASYQNDRFVIDNGYLYVSLRYGLVFLPFYWVVHFLCARKNRKMVLVLIVMIVVALTNFIDNDLNSYGFLPLILIAFNNYSFDEDNTIIEDGINERSKGERCATFG